jgi:hypothetical protein
MPEYSVNLRLHHIHPPTRQTYLKELGIVIFHTNIDDALMLLGDSPSLASKLFEPIDSNRSRILLETKSMSKTAYKCRSHHEYGLAYVLFKISGDKTAATDIIEMFASPFVKQLL